MNFYLDENFPKAAIEQLTAIGHQCYDQRETDAKGSSDLTLFESAQRLCAGVLTTDRDFFHTIRHQFPTHEGIVVVTLKKPNRAAILEKFEWLMNTFTSEEIRGRSFLLREKGCVVQPPLSQNA